MSRRVRSHRATSEPGEPDAGGERAPRNSPAAPPTSLIERLGRWNLRRLGARSRIDVIVTGATSTSLHAYVFDPHPKSPPDAPPLVLMHGVGSSATTFARLLRRLRPHFGTIYVPEAPAHGGSAIPASPFTPDALFELVSGWLDTVPPAPFVLYGNSLGGGAALRYAALRSERVSALLLLSPAGAHGSESELEELVASFDLKTSADAARFMGRLFERPRWYHRLAGNELRRRFASPPLREFFARAGRDDLLDPATVSALPMPVLLLWGKAERLLPDSHRRWFARHLPAHANLVEPPHFAHSAYIEHSAEVAELALGFLAAHRLIPHPERASSTSRDGRED